MGTLADSFLEDLENLEKEDVEEEAGANKDPNDAEKFESDEEAPIVDAVEEYFNTSGAAENSFSPMLRDPEVNATVEKAKRLALGEELSASEVSFIEQCNKTVLEIDKEIINIYNYVKDIYSKRFPKLESIVYSPLDYIAVVKRAQNESDFTKVDLTDLLPNTMIMAITVTSTMALGSSLSTQVLNKALGACNEGMQLAELRNDLLVYLEGRMSMVAPNVAAIIGSALTARLIAKVGSLETLAKIPSQNLMLVGADKNQSYVVNSGSRPHAGILNTSDIVQNSESSVRKKALKLVASKVSLAAKIDLFRQHRDGLMGHNYRNFVLQSLNRVGRAHAQALEPPPAPTKKSLPRPEERKGRRRGGRRYRKLKEKYTLGELQKHRNRLKFGAEAEDELGMEGRRASRAGEGFGMIGKSDLGRLGIRPKKSKIHIRESRSRAAKKRVVAMQASAPTSGMASSLVFTPLQGGYGTHSGIELCNPSLSKEVKRKSVLDNQEFVRLRG